MPPLPPSRAPIILRPSLPTMLLLRPRNLRRSTVRRLRILEAIATWTAVGCLVWYLLSH